MPQQRSRAIRSSKTTAKQARKKTRSGKPVLTLLGRNARKAEPRLRLIANGDLTVNTTRADTCASVALAKNVSLKSFEKEKAKTGKPAKKGKQGKLPADILVNVFISTDTRLKLPKDIITETDRIGRLATATIRLSQLKQLLDQEDVRHVALAQSLKDPDPQVLAQAAAMPGPDSRLIEGENIHQFGKKVMIGIIDVGGFDFSHPDFLDAKGNTRFVEIWDQGGDPNPNEPAPFNIGRIITAKRMNQAIKSAKGAGAPAYLLEPQSGMTPGSHGTHVTSIAAGNRGICRRAEIAAVLIGLPHGDLDRRKSFYDSTRLAHAVSYLHDLARRRNRPISINISLGTNGHSHDASAAVNRWIDAILSEPGRCLSVAAGNAGQERGLSPDDAGFILGRIHSSGRIAAAGLTADLEWIVGGTGVADYSENECEIWFAPQDRFTLAVRRPDGTWTETIEPRQFVENRMLSDGSFLSIYNELYNAANGLNRISVYLSPNMKTGKPIASGKWILRLTGNEVRDGRYHAWVERDDPIDIGPALPDGRRRMRFPSFFSAASNVDNTSISTLACANYVIAVANLDAAREQIHITSSQGPTRDKRPKPDIAAPGTAILAANGFSDTTTPWIGMTGTSMASPFACGVAGLMLATAPALTAAQIAGILHRTATPLPGDDYEWRDYAGFGRINAKEALSEAARINEQKDRT